MPKDCEYHDSTRSCSGCDGHPELTICKRYLVAQTLRGKPLQREVWAFDIPNAACKYNCEVLLSPRYEDLTVHLDIEEFPVDKNEVYKLAERFGLKLTEES